MKLAYDIESLSFGYNGNTVLEIDRLQAASGEILGLEGPNGSGKTTLLHVMAFILRPNSGSIKFFGQDTTNLEKTALRRRVGLLLQHPYMFGGSVIHNITWGLKIRGIPRKDRIPKATQALSWVGLEGFEKRDARSLSGGETQRVALARSLVLDPDVLLLDEHSNHMDKESVQKVEQVVMDRNRSKGNTVIFAGHFHDRKTGLEPHRVINIEDLMRSSSAQLE